MVIRNAFKVAVIICPSKETFLTKVSGSLTEDQVNAMWVTCEENMKKISDMLWTFYKSEEMNELPLTVFKQTQQSSFSVKWPILDTASSTVTFFWLRIDISHPAFLNSSTKSRHLQNTLEWIYLLLVFDTVWNNVMQRSVSIVCELVGICM